MADKKSTCGCGCIPLKQNSAKATKEEKKSHSKAIHENDVYCKCGGVKMEESEFCKDCI